VDDVASPADTGAVAHLIVDALATDLCVEGDDGHHLARARRLRVGEMVTAADGHGAWRSYTVTSTGRGSVALSASGATRREPILVPGLAVAFALTKGTKPEVVVRQLTELGVDALIPVLAERSVVRPKRAHGDPMPERLARVAREAAMQSRRARLPEIGAPCALLALVERPDLVVAEREAEVRAVVPAEPASGAWTLLVGPEGGFSPAEVEALATVPRLAVGLQVLRAETAAVAAASLLTVRRRPGGASRAI
jgi:16S rRNA (uracil1498-N3)-methyltransferase